jgi:uncharacterized pyridoxamine 5'-phosphate oxidase family protein
VKPKNKINNMQDYVKKFLMIADSKALATYANQDINVVPVSTVKVEGDEIWLVDYFMDKTVKNIIQNENVSFVAWKDLFGYQIKCKAKYENKGEKFDKTVEFVKQILPERVVKGVLVLSPKEIFDVSPTKNTKEHFLLSL